MFQYRSFIKNIYDNFKTSLTLKEVEEILNVDFDYIKDSPNSTGNTLTLTRLVFEGKKDTGDDIFYDQKLEKGVNVWIAENFSGKSSMFKIIKLALTGKNTIKKDVSKWIHKIFLEFEIGNGMYCVYIDLGGRAKGGLFRLAYENVRDKEDDLQSLEMDTVFEFRSLTELEERMEDFFFHQLSYYPLKWTQKSSKKEDMGLTEAKTSWKTYFKSIYLESADYNTLFLNENFGAQEKKILEMILGLELTYPINRLSIKRDMLKNELGKNTIIKSYNSVGKHEDPQFLLGKLAEIDSKIESLSKQEFNTKQSVDEYNELCQLLRLESSNKDDLLRHSEELIKEKTRIKKVLLNIEEHLEFGAYFTGLDIKVCPQCNNSVDKKRKEDAHHLHCDLCNKPVSAPVEDITHYEQKLKDLKTAQSNLEDELADIDKKTTAFGETIASINTRLLECEKLLNQKKDVNSTYFVELADLLVDKGKLSFQLDNLSKFEMADSTDLEEHINVIELAIQRLEELRFENSQKIFKRFNEVVINQLSLFGLGNIERVVFDKSLNITFVQNSISNKFSELNEGEQLRVKIAFYLALIKMDIEYKLGRHPRFIIIDSPGKEEVIQRDLTGLSEVFKTIEYRVGNELQIFVGTALQEFSKATVADKVVYKKTAEYIF
jgi:hypothetical protein